MKIIPIENCTESNVCADLSFDVYGNMYLSHNDVTYQLCIDGKNNAYIDEADYTVISSDEIEFGKIINTTHLEKQEQQIQEVNEDYNSDCDDDDPDNMYLDEHDPYGSVSDKFYIEEKNYMFNISAIDHSYSKFYFCKSFNCPQVSVLNRKNGDNEALYDTFIYNDNNECCFRTKLVGEPPFYVVRISKHGIEMRDIYDISRTRSYKVQLNSDNKLVLIQ